MSSATATQDVAKIPEPTSLPLNLAHEASLLTESIEENSSPLEHLKLSNSKATNDTTNDQSDSEESLDIIHGYPDAPSPPPPSISPGPLRHPETLGTLVAVQKTKHKGDGLFALKDIPAGTVLLFEKPFFTIKDKEIETMLNLKVHSLPPDLKSSWNNLHAFYRDDQRSKNRAILATNAFNVDVNSVEASAVFDVGSRTNHSHAQNTVWAWFPESGRLMFWNRVKLREGDELTIDYGHEKERLKTDYGFDCCCEVCRGDTADAKDTTMKMKR